MTGQISLIDDEIPEAGEIKQVVEGIYWLRMPLPLALDHINLYLIEDPDGWTLIDTGMNLPDTIKLWEVIFDKYFSEKPLKQIVVTHMHPDHVGLAGWLSEYWLCPILMSQVEYFAVRSYVASEARRWRAEQYFRECGLDEEFITNLHKRSFFRDIVSKMPGSYIQLRDKQVVEIGGDSWQVVIGGGHSFAHVSLYCAQRKLLLAGDQILPSITPNVSVMATEPEASPLHAWYESLERLKTLDKDTLVMPAHKKPFTGLHQRADELIDHHESQLQVILSECQTWTKPMDLMKPLFGREIGSFEMALAMGECKAHLHMLLDRDLILRELRDGVEHYQSKVQVSPDDVEYEVRGSLQV